MVVHHLAGRTVGAGYLPAGLYSNDAIHRLIFNIHPTDAIALMASASAQEVQAVRDLLRIHLSPTAEIAVPVSASIFVAFFRSRVDYSRQVVGLDTFELKVSIPYFTLSSRPSTDNRRIRGRLLRKSYPLPTPDALQRPNVKPGEGIIYLNESRFTLVLTGIKDRIWTSYVLLDNTNSPESSSHTIDTCTANEHFGLEIEVNLSYANRDARLYFLQAWSRRMPRVAQEWSAIVYHLYRLRERQVIF